MRCGPAISRGRRPGNEKEQTKSPEPRRHRRDPARSYIGRDELRITPKLRRVTLRWIEACRIFWAIGTTEQEALSYLLRLMRARLDPMRPSEQYLETALARVARVVAACWEEMEPGVRRADRGGRPPPRGSAKGAETS